MARKLVNGTVPAIGTTFGTVTAISTMSNANPCVMGFAAGHTINVGDYFEVSASGWPQLAGRVFRASVVASDNITAEGLDTLSTTKYPAGQGAGTGRSIETWTAIQQVNADGLTTEGGEQQYLQGQYIDSADGLQYQLPTNKTPITLAMIVDDDQALSYWTPVRAAAEALTNYPIRLTYPNSTGVAVGTGIFTFSAAPEMKGNNVQKRTINVSLANRFTEYAT